MPLVPGPRRQASLAWGWRDFALLAQMAFGSGMVATIKGHWEAAMQAPCFEGKETEACKGAYPASNRPLGKRTRWAAPRWDPYTSSAAFLIIARLVPAGEGRSQGEKCARAERGSEEGALGERGAGRWAPRPAQPWVVDGHHLCRGRPRALA